MQLDEYFGDWLKVIDVTELNKAVTKLNAISQVKPIVPAYKDIFKAFTLCSEHDVKIVFLGQDPYPQKGVATGVLFGNKEGTTELSPSLEVIKEAAINYEIPHPPLKFDVTLESWAKQGILMINSALTCEMNKVGSHVMLWRPFISKFLQNLSNSNTGLVYVLFGDQAQTFEPYINKRLNSVIKVHHPAFYARTHTKMPYWVFTELNKMMKDSYGIPIKWYEESLT
jgi:uracil-DNA glycosylase